MGSNGRVGGKAAGLLFGRDQIKRTSPPASGPLWHATVHRTDSSSLLQEIGSAERKRSPIDDTIVSRPLCACSGQSLIDWPILTAAIKTNRGFTRPAAPKPLKGERIHLHSSTMKKIILTTMVSLGGLHPFIAIALALKQRGLHPVLGVPEDFVAKTQAAGLEAFAISPAEKKSADMAAWIVNSPALPGSATIDRARHNSPALLSGPLRPLSRAAIAGSQSQAQPRRRLLSPGHFVAIPRETK